MNQKYDDKGLNIADPSDILGFKNDYITLLQQTALTQIVRTGTGPSLDVGCGTGRMTRFFNSLGYTTCGLDPSLRLLQSAKTKDPKGLWCVGALPDMPFRSHSLENVFLINVLRPLHLLGIKSASADLVRLLRGGGRLIVLDNIAPGNTKYVEHDWIINHFSDLGLQLESVTPIRFGRRLLTYLIQFGFIPKRFFPSIAAREISRAANANLNEVSSSYLNVVYVFRKPRG